MAAEEEQGAQTPLVTHVSNILHSIFSIVEVYINYQPIYNSNGLYAQKFYISNNFKGTTSEYKGFYAARDMIMKKFPTKFWKRFCLNIFSQRRRKCLADQMDSYCKVNGGLIFSVLLNCCIQTQKSNYD